MSKRHQASRRRSYGRRLHEIRERSNLRLLTKPSERNEAQSDSSSAAEVLVLAERGLQRPAFGFGH